MDPDIAKKRAHRRSVPRKKKKRDKGEKKGLDSVILRKKEGGLTKALGHRETHDLWNKGGVKYKRLKKLETGGKAEQKAPPWKKGG